MNHKTKTIIGIVVFAVFLGAAAAAYGTLSSKYTIQPPIQVTEQPAEPLQEEQKQPVAAPDSTVVDGEGNEVKLSDYFGTPIVLNFWASWCPPCKSEMPHFDQVYREVGEQVTFLMVDLVDGQRETIQKGTQYVTDSGYAFPVLFDTQQSAAITYGVSSIPSTVFIDKDGNIVAAMKGAMDEQTLRQGIALITE